jgi:hypothetical protein
MNRKRLLSVLLIAICQNIAFSQVVPPQGISYQAVIINRNIKELPGKDITESYYSNMEMIVKFSILSSQTGPTEYEETQNAITDVYGLLNLVIGQGKPIGAAFNTIDWSINAKWLKVDIDFNKEGFFEPFSLEKMWSVPYAFYSEQSSDSLILKVNGTDRQLKLGEKSPIFFSVADNDSVATNEIQILTLNGGSLLLSLGGGMITLPDSSATNELQTISKTGNTVTLSQGGGSFNDDDKQTLSVSGTGNIKTMSISDGNSVQININDADSSPTNELQTISLSGGRITLNQNGGTLTLPDSSATNELQTISKTGNTVTLSQGGGSITVTDNQNLSTSGTGSTKTISISGGNNVNIDVFDGDSSTTNELQTISQSLNKGTVSLSKNGGSIVLPDSSATNEMQTLTLTSNGVMKTIAITQGDSVTFSVNDGDTTYWKKESTGIYYKVGRVGIGASNTEASSVLQVSSTTQGALMPRMTEAQRIAILTPALGLLVFQTNNTAGFYFYNGTAWVLLGSGSSSNSGSSNNTLIYTSDGF